MSPTTEVSGHLSALDDDLNLIVGGVGGIAIQITGTFVGTLAFEATVDGGTYRPLNMTAINGSTQVTGATAPGLWIGSVTGLTRVRVRCSAYTSGAMVVLIKTSQTPPGGGAGGGGGGGGGTSSAFDAAFPADGTAIGFKDPNGNMVPGNVDINGNILVSGTGGGGGAVTIANGADVAEGSTTDAAALDANGTVNAHARGIAKVLADVWDSVNHWFKVSIQNATLAVTQSGAWALSAGAAIIGKVGIDQTTPGTTDSVSVATGQGAGATVGVTTGAAVITDANGTLQQYLRGLIKLITTAGSFLVTAAQSGTWTVQPGNTANTTAWLVTSGHGKTLKSASGSFTADTDVIAAVSSKRIKVFALKVETFGTSATTIIWKSNGTGGTELWRSIVQAIASTKDGETHAVSVPSFLFATTAGEKLTADTNTGDTIHYTISYWDDDAS